MTEEDTLRILKRTPLPEMATIIRDWRRNTRDTRDLNELLETHSWSFNEFRIAVKSTVIPASDDIPKGDFVTRPQDLGVGLRNV